MNPHDDPHAGRTVAWGIVGAILVVVIIVALQAFFRTAQNAEIRRKTHGVAPEELSRLVAKQQEQLNSYGWIDQDAGIAAIPIDRAMELVVQELRGRAEEPPKEEGE